MLHRTTAAVAFAAALTALPAAAQVLGIGTTKGGATEQVANGVAKVVSSHSGMQMRSQPMGGTNQYIPIVDAGQLEFGVGNMMQTWMAYTAIGMSKGDPKAENLRLVANLLKFQTGAVVANKSDIKTVGDLKGKRIPYGFKQAVLFHFVAEGILRNAGLEWKDVTQVPHVGLAQHWDSFKAGKIDMVISTTGAAANTEMDTVIDGGIRYLSLDDSPAAVERMQAILPRTYLDLVEPAPNLAGVRTPVKVIAYDYMVFAHKGVADDIVYKVAKAMYENEAEFKALGPLWRTAKAADMGKDEGMPYHPGAEKLYKEVGIWKR